jgi:ribosomal protein L37AE/L43A
MAANIQKGIVDLRATPSQAVQVLVADEVAPGASTKPSAEKDGKNRKHKIQDKEESMRHYLKDDERCQRCRTGSVKRDVKRSLLVCEACGAATQFMDCTYSSVGFYDSPIEWQSFSYRRITHFTEWLNSSQGKENSNISKATLHKIMGQLIRLGKCSADDIETKDVRLALKSLKLQRFYENAPSITSLLTGRPPPRFSDHEERLLKQMFHSIQAPFASVAPPERKNFLSYSYVLYKFCELLGLKYTHLFRLLKGREKLMRQDEIWRDICHQLGWRYYPTKLPK